MGRKLTEVVKFVQAITPQDIATDRTSAYQPMKDVGRVVATANIATVAEGKKATIQILQAKDSSGTGAKALSALVEDTAGTGGEAMYLKVEAEAADMDDGFTHVAVQVTSDTAVAVIGSADLLFGDFRYNPVA